MNSTNHHSTGNSTTHNHNTKPDSSATTLSSPKPTDQGTTPGHPPAFRTTAREYINPVDYKHPYDSMAQFADFLALRYDANRLRVQFHSGMPVQFGSTTPDLPNSPCPRCPKCGRLLEFSIKIPPAYQERGPPPSTAKPPRARHLLAPRSPIPSPMVRFLPRVLWVVLSLLSWDALRHWLTRPNP